MEQDPAYLIPKHQLEELARGKTPTGLSADMKAVLETHGEQSGVKKPVTNCHVFRK